MVFRIHCSKFPGAKAPVRERPCLEHMQLHLRLSAALFLSLVSFKKRIPWGIQRGFCGLALAQPNGMDKASCLISMVFEICRPKSAGTHTPIQEKPCLDNLLLSRFWQPSPEYLPHNKAAHPLSMVFRIHRSKSPGAKASARERPCLEHVQPHPSPHSRPAADTHLTAPYQPRGRPNPWPSPRSGPEQREAPAQRVAWARGFPS